LDERTNYGCLGQQQCPSFPKCDFLHTTAMTLSTSPGLVLFKVSLLPVETYYPALLGFLFVFVYAYACGGVRDVFVIDFNPAFKKTFVVSFQK
jgi:hypothetical protein